MGLDLSTLLRAAGQGIVGHKQGKIAGEERKALAQEREEEKRQRELENYMRVLEHHARLNPVKSPVSWQMRQLEDGTIVQVNPVTGEVRKPEDGGQPIRGERPAPRVPPRPERPFSATDPAGVRGSFTDAEEARTFAGGSGGGLRRILDPSAKAVDTTKFDLTTPSGSMGVGALGGEPENAMDQPALGGDFKELVVKNRLRQEIRGQNPDLSREEIEAEVERRIRAASF